MKETKFAYKGKDGKWVYLLKNYIKQGTLHIYWLDFFDPVILYTSKSKIKEDLSNTLELNVINDELWATKVNPADFKLVEIEVEYKIPEFG